VRALARTGPSTPSGAGTHIAIRATPAVRAGMAAAAVRIWRSGLVSRYRFFFAYLCLNVLSAAVLWGNPRGRDRRLDTLPLFLVAVAGAVLVILQATDGVHRDSFGSSNTDRTSDLCRSWRR